MARRGGKLRSKARHRSRRTSVDPLARERALDALSRMRAENLSLTRAARKAQTTPQTVRKYVGQALRRTSGGRYRPTPSDRLTRRVWLLTPRGKIEIAVRGSRPASRVARHMAAVDLYLREGRTDALREFKRQSLRSGKKTYTFITDPRVLDRLAQAGEVSFERLYVLRA